MGAASPLQILDGTEEAASVLRRAQKVSSFSQRFVLGERNDHDILVSSPGDDSFLAIVDNIAEHFRVVRAGLGIAKRCLLYTSDAADE